VTAGALFTGVAGSVLLADLVYRDTWDLPGGAVEGEEPAITPADFSIVNEPGTDSYPITGYSWALVYTHQPSQARGQALVRLLDWLTLAGQADAATNGYVPLPARIRQLAHAMLQKVTGPGRTRLLGVARAG
jgi:hypothetical protein